MTHLRLAAAYVPASTVATPPLSLTHWLTLVFALTSVLALIFMLEAPDLFLLLGPLLLISLASAAAVGTSTLIHPPRWVDVALIVLAFGLMEATLRKGGIGGSRFDSQSLVKGAVWAIVLLYAGIHGARRALSGPLLTALLVYCLFAFGSAFYSKAFALGVGSGIALLAIAFYAAYVSAWPTERVHRLWLALFATIVLMCVLSVVTYFVLPGWARDFRSAGAGRLNGVTGSGNSLGSLAAIGMVIGVYAVRTASSRSHAFLRAFLIVIVAIALSMTQSRSAMIALAAAFIVVFALRSLLTAMVFAGLAAVATWLLLQPQWLQTAMAAVSSALSRTGRVAEITSVTGRTEIWAALLPTSLASPWIGYGLGSPRIVVAEAYVGRWGDRYESAHNWLLESVISVGMVGTALLVVFLVLLAWHLWRLRHRMQLLGPAMERADLLMLVCMQRCFVLVLFRGLTEKGFAGMASPDTVVLAIIAGAVIAVAKATEDTSRHPRRQLLHVMGRRQA
jgi:O-antigen ligase